MNARNLGLLFGALVTAAASTCALAGKDRPVSGPHPSPGGRVNSIEGDLETRSCAEAAVSTLNLAAAYGFHYELILPPPNWRVFAPDDFLDGAFLKQAAEYLKGCPRLPRDVLADPGELVQLLQGLLNDSKLGFEKRLTADRTKVFRMATPQEESGSPGVPSPPSTGSPTGQPNPAPPATGQPSAAPAAASPGQSMLAPPITAPGQPMPAPPAAFIGQPQQDLAGRLIDQMKQIDTRLESLNGSVSSLLKRPPPSQQSNLPSLLQLVLVGFVFVASTLAFMGTRRLSNTMPEPQLLKNLRDEILRSRQRASEADTLAGETQHALSRIDAALRALRSEIGSLRRAPAPEQESLARPLVPQPAAKASEPLPLTPPAPGPRGRQTPSDDEWCAAYNDALSKQNLDGFRSRHGGVWTRIQDRTTRPASLVPVDHPPERGILDGFLYVPNGHSRRGWVFPGPNFYAARSAISTGQMMLEAFGGIFEAQPGEVYALRQPAIAVEGRTGLTIENPGLILL
jgi:hypothetical protein